MDRETQLKEFRTWLIENMPQTPAELRSKNFVSNKERIKFIDKKINRYKERCRITKALISRIAIKTALSEDQIIRGANTILEMIEKELTKGYKVIIEHFGEFGLKKLHNSNYDIGITFKNNEIWLKGFNDPIKASELGLLNTLPRSKTRKLRRIT